jgi:hypothetical protein
MQGRGKLFWLVNKMGVWRLLVCGKVFGDGDVGTLYVLQVFFKCSTSFLLNEQVLVGGGEVWERSLC